MVSAVETQLNLALLRNPDGKRRFEWTYDSLGRQVLIVLRHDGAAATSGGRVVA